MYTDVKLEVLKKEDKEQFIIDNQEAFNYGALEEFGLRDNHFEDEENEEIISRETIEKSISDGIAYRIVVDDKKVGGIVLRVSENEGELDLLFVKPDCHTKGIGFAAWCLVEEMYPQIMKWTTCTPYFEKRNIHFYINKCGFHVVEFFNKYHKDPNDPDMIEMPECQKEEDFDGMFKFEKIIKRKELK